MTPRIVRWSLVLLALPAFASLAAPGLSPAAAASRTPVYRSPGYVGTTRAPATKPLKTPAPIALSASGRFPQTIVDAGGTAHIVWVESSDGGADVLRYCRIKRGERACDNPPGSQSFVPDHPYGDGDGPQFNTDGDGPRVVAVGDQVVIMTHRYPTAFPKPDMSDVSNSTLIWVSEDGGTTFTGPGLVGNQSINGSAAVEFGPDNDPTIGVITDTVTGGTFFQAIRPGAFTSAQANLGDGGPDRAYSGSLAVDGGRPVAAFADLNRQTFVRQWTGTAPISDASTWTAPTVIAGDEPRLAGGPGGLFLMNRPGVNGPYAVRRMGAGLAPGAPATVSDSEGAVFGQLFEDPSGRVVAAWESRDGKTPGVRLRSATDGTHWAPAQQVFDGAAAGQIGVAAASDGGGFAVANQTGGVNQPGPIVGTPFGPQGATGKPGLGSLAGGGDRSATSTCARLAFGAVEMDSQAGCFLHGTGGSAGVTVSTGEINLNGLHLVPDAGVSIMIDPRAHTVNTTGAVSVLLEGEGITVTLFHGALHLQLPVASAGTTLFSFDQSAFGLDLFGFGAKGRVDVILTPDGVRVPVSLGLPPVLGDVRGAATLIADRTSGLHFNSLHIHVGNILLGPLLIDHLDIDYAGDSDTWSGDGAVQFPPAGAGGGLALIDVAFQHGAYKHAGFEYTPPPPGIVIGPFVYLNSIGGELGLDPTHIGADAKIGAGTPGVGGISPVNIDGRFDMTFPSHGPADFKMSGAVSFFVFDIATGYLDFQSDGYAGFGGEVGGDFGPIHIAASADGFVDATNGNFGADVKGDACVNISFDVPITGNTVDLGCVGLGGEIAVSNAGFAACASFNVPAYGEASGGIDYPFADFSPALLLNPAALTVSIIAHLSFPCHAGRYHVPPRPAVSSATARAAQAGGTAVTLPAGNPSETIVVNGTAAAPHVTVAGPGGAHVGGDGAQAGYTIVPKGGTTTFVVLKKPAAGTWTVTPQADSAPIGDVLVGDGYVPAAVQATLAGAGRARSIRYAITHLGSGQTVAFAEKGTFGTHILGVARGAHGTLRFAPADARGGRRTVLALVRHEGVVTDTRIVGHYTAPGPLRPAPVTRVRATVTGRAVTVSWGSASGAAAYAVRIHGSHGRSELHVVKAGVHRLRVTGVLSGERVTVRVAGVSRGNRTGPAPSVRASGRGR